MEKPMKSKQIFFYVTVILFFAVGIYILIIKSNNKNISDLYPRKGDSNLSAEYKNALRSVDFYRDQIENTPGDPKNYTGLAQVFLQEARITGKHHEYLPKILSLLKTALNIDKENLDANLTKASVLLNLHQFEEAAKIGEWAVKKYPYSSAAYGVLVDAYVELGKYEKAVEMCDKMLMLKPDLRSYARASYLREIHGDNQGAIDAMRMAADAGATGMENRAWALYNLANLYLNEGKTDTAEFIYNGILEERPGYAYALLGLAKVMIVKGNYSKAEDYLKQASINLDEHSFIERLADLYLALGNKIEEEKLNQIVFQEFEEHEKGGWDIDLEYSMFCLNHNINLDEALMRAEREYEQRPNNIDVIDTYAWALYKNGKSE
jgi:pentatricopeptide repeat protein